MIESFIHFLTFLFYLLPVAAVLWAIAGVFYLFSSPDSSGFSRPPKGGWK